MKIAKGTTAVSAPINVCMHVLGTARTDMRVMRAAIALVEAGFVVSVVDIETDYRKSTQEDFSGVQVRHIMAPNWQASKRFKPWFLLQSVLMLARSTLLLLRSPADVYHAHETKALPACYLAARLRRKRLIFDAHELPMSAERGNKRWRGLITLFSTLLTIIVPHCAAVITVSPPIAREIGERYGIANVTLVRNVPAYQAIPRGNRLRQYLGLRPDARIALYQGGLLANRELDRLVRAATFLEQGIVIVLMGPDSEGTRAQLEALIDGEGVTDRVKIIPPVPYAELLEWTASADIGLIIYPPDRSLNIRMCLPNKLFEYLMIGLPVLASSLDAVSEIIRAYDVGCVLSTLEPIDVGMAINGMLANRVVLSRMSRNALDTTRQNLCWEKESQRLIRLYHRVLALRDDAGAE